MSHHLLIAQDLSYDYPDGTSALQKINFTITHGQSVGIIGPNGAGKSTLIFCLNGYVLPTSGKVIVGETELTKSTREEIRKRVGVVFPNPDDQLFMPTVREDVAFGPANLSLSLEMVEKRVTEALTTMDSLVLAGKSPYHLSDGQKRSIAIATVLAMQPDILVMDEPTSNLDPFTRRKLIHFLKGFLHTKIIASHDLDLVWEVCDRVILLYQSKVIADGPTQEILKNEELLKKHRLELPLRLQK